MSDWYEAYSPGLPKRELDAWHDLAVEMRPIVLSDLVSQKLGYRLMKAARSPAFVRAFRVLAPTWKHEIAEAQKRQEYIARSFRENPSRLYDMADQFGMTPQQFIEMKIRDQMVSVENVVRREIRDLLTNWRES